MVYLIPNYSVSYGGKWYRAGEKVIISPVDIAELSSHGVIHEEKDENSEKEVVPTQKQGTKSKKK